jgi:hypothetical protein
MIQIYFSKKNILEKEVLIIGKNKLEIIDQDKIKKYIFKFIELNLINKLYYLPHPRETNSLDISFENKVQINSYINIEAMPEYVISLGSSGIELFRLTKSKRIFLRPMLSDKLTRNSLRSNITADIILDI